MEEKIKVSVIVLVYHHEKYLRKALESIVSQEMDFPAEVLVGEDASPDSSREILKEFERRYPGVFTVIYRDENIGGTRNAYDLLCRAKGKYLAYLEGDDYWVDPRKLQKQADFLDANPEYQGVAGDFLKVDGDGRTIAESSLGEAYKNKRFVWEDFLRDGFVYQTGTFMFRNFFLDGGDYSVFYRAHELVGDLTISTIVLNRGDVFLLPDVLSAYRVVLSPEAVNACSISSRNAAVSELKTLRQCAMLNGYVMREQNFDEKISRLKLDFLVNLLKRRPGFTWSLFSEALKLGSRRTNLRMAVYFAEELMRKALPGRRRNTDKEAKGR